MKKIILLIVLFLGAKSFSQTNGITYQAVILNPSGEQLPGINNTTSPMVTKNICLQFQFIDEFSKLEYQETIQTKTDVFGMVNLIIGSGNQTAGYAVSFKTIEWKALKKSMIVSINTSGSCSSFTEISNQPFTAVPFAFSAINAGNVTGVVDIQNGGTNAVTVVGAKTNLDLEKVDNVSDADKPISLAAEVALVNKVDKVVGKDLSTNDYTTAEQTKLASILGTNTGDQDLSVKVDKVVGKDLSTNDYTTAEQTKLASILGTNTGDQDLSVKVDKVVGKDLSTNDYTTAEQTKLVAITGTNTGDQDLTSLAPLASPTFTGTPTLPVGTIGVTKIAGDNTTALATTEYVKTAINNVPSGPFATASNVSSNSSGTIATDDFVFGSTSLAGITGTDDDSRMFFDKSKAAFRAGSAVGTQWDDIDVGAYSTAMGLDTKASGAYSMAIGGGTTASGSSSFAMGGGTSATGSSSVAMGGGTTASGAYSMAIGGGTTASGSSSFAMGGGTSATGSSSVAMGGGTMASGDLSVAIGGGTKASGNSSVAMGGGTTASGTYSMATGESTTAPSYTETAIGSYNTTYTPESTTELKLADRLFVIGNGAKGANSDALVVLKNGNTTLKGELTLTNGSSSYTLPNKDGSANEVLITNGSGVLSWSTAASGGSSGVPYTGATGPVDLGAYDLKVNGLVIGKGSGSIANNTAIGQGALLANTSGDFNTANGAMALYSNTTGSNITANGAMALYSNTTGSNNTANGTGALYYNTTGSNNIANGHFALFSNTLGSENTANGVGALWGNKTGGKNIAVGTSALSNNNSGSGNTALGSYANVSLGSLDNATAIGANAIVNASNKIQLGDGSVTAVQLGTGTNVTLETGLVKITGGAPGANKVLTSDANGLASWAAAASSGVPYTGATQSVDLGNFDLTLNGITAGKGNGSIGSNTAFGVNALNANTTGDSNTANGAGSLSSNTTGIQNTANGFNSLQSNTTGSFNSANGLNSLFSNTSGSDNTANGAYSLYSNTTGRANTANGVGSLHKNTTGGDNSAHGINSLYSNTTGSNNTANGDNSLHLNTTGGSNTANGEASLFSNTIGNENTAFGANADVSSASLTNATAIGFGAKVGASNSIQLGNANVTNVKTSGTITAGVVTYPNTHNSTADQVLITDANGLASWVTQSSTATSYSGVLPLANGGTGSASQNFVDITTNQTVAGTKTFSSDLKVNGVTVGTGGGSAASAEYNTAVGLKALVNNTGWGNTAVGRETLTVNANSNNTAVGYKALTLNVNGNNNVAVGSSALAVDTDGNINTAIGAGTLRNNISGSRNTAIGAYALTVNKTGSNNTALGSTADVGSDNLSNATAIGFNAIVNASNKIQLGDGSVTAVQLGTGINVTLETGLVKITGGTPGANKVLTSDANGLASWKTPAATTTFEITDEWSSNNTNTILDGQLEFYLSGLLAPNSKIKMYINGIRISNYAYSLTADKVTYFPAKNGNKTVLSTDRVQFDYSATALAGPR
jgi:hypothetical protein